MIDIDWEAYNQGFKNYSPSHPSKCPYQEGTREADSWYLGQYTAERNGY